MTPPPTSNEPKPPPAPPPRGDLERYRRRYVDPVIEGEVVWDEQTWEYAIRLPDWEEGRLHLPIALRMCILAGYRGINQTIFDQSFFKLCLIRINDLDLQDESGTPIPTRWRRQPPGLLEAIFRVWAKATDGTLPRRGSGKPPASSSASPSPSDEEEESPTIPTPTTSSTSGSSEYTSSEASFEPATPTSSSSAGPSPT